MKYQVGDDYRMRWVYKDHLSVDNIGDPIEMTAGRPIVYADDIDPDYLPSIEYNESGAPYDYLVRKCWVCLYYFRDVMEHMRTVHGMNEREIFTSGINQMSSPQPRGLIGPFFVNSSTPLPVRRSRFFEQ